MAPEFTEGLVVGRIGQEQHQTRQMKNKFTPVQPLVINGESGIATSLDDTIPAVR